MDQTISVIQTMNQICFPTTSYHRCLQEMSFNWEWLKGEKGKIKFRKGSATGMEQERCTTMGNKIKES